MEDKIKIEEIVGYFPHNLECEILNYTNDYIGEQFGIIKGYYYYNNEPHYNFKDSRDYAGKDSGLFKPVLRPLSDLTKEIEVSGERFVPIIELAKLSDSYNEIKGIDKVYSYNSKVLDIEDYIVDYYSNGELIMFQYSAKSERFAKAAKNRVGYGNLSFIGQLKMFQKLYEWHFDIHRLIDRGLAIRKE